MWFLSDERACSFDVVTDRQTYDVGADPLPASARRRRTSGRIVCP